MTTRSARGFTLVELLVVISIIGILMTLLVPGIQGARELTRRTQCLNNLRNLAAACINHEANHGILPTGGWGYMWVGDPDRGFDRRQTGGWCYNILPYIDQQVLHDLQFNTTAPANQSEADRQAQKRKDLKRMVSTPLSLFICPSRRRVIAYPYSKSQYQIYNADLPTVVGRTDYAANAGSLTPTEETGPASLAAGDARKPNQWPAANHNGICYQRSEVRTDDIRDGASNTYLLAERSIDPDHYADGVGSSDDQSLYIGHDRDILVWTNKAYPPMQDQEGVDGAFHFGSAHAAGFNAAFGDGTVRLIYFEIDPEVHARLGSRADLLPVDMTKF